jgi:hypothetical protein
MIAISRRNLIQDAVRRYTVFIDDKAVGTIPPLRSRRFVVPPGHHVVRLTVGSGPSSSDEVPVDVEMGRIARLRTWARQRRLPFSIKGVLTFLVNPGGFGLGLWAWDPFGLWGDCWPWITLHQGKPQPGPRRFDARSSPPSTEASLRADTPLVRFVREARFDVQRNGYSVEDVDRFTARLVARLEDGETLTARDLDVTFRRGILGYARSQVDAFVESVKANILAWRPLG